MKVLFVARCKNGRYAPFITEQVDALIKAGIECEYFAVKKNGYYKQFFALRKAIKQFKPDIIHAHYGLCGLFANTQRITPVITTYHGSDINDSLVFLLSNISIKKSAFNIFVSKENIKKAKPKERFALIPCGIFLEDYPDICKLNARDLMGLAHEKKYVLFAGAFNNQVKNPDLAKAAVSKLKNVELIELKGYSRQEVATLMHAVDALLLTSFSEGSPQVIKEALACNCPIVSVNVGDVSEHISDIKGCYITKYNADEISNRLSTVLYSVDRIEGRQIIINKGLTNNTIANRIIDIYNAVSRK